jgi:hypothetical protein
MKITFKQLEDMIDTAPDLFEEIHGDRDLNENTLSYYLSECNHQVFTDFTSGRYNIDLENETIDINLDNIHPAASFADIFAIEIRLPDAIMRSYDDDLYPWENDAWEHYGCSGDDDVDYNGSYLMIFNDAIHLYLIKTKMIYKTI